MTAPEAASAEPILRVRDLTVHFPIRSKGVLRRQIGVVHAVDGVSFEINRGETLGLVGESGCGKSTTGRAIIQLTRPTSGSVIFENRDLTRMKGRELRAFRSRAQMIFQDPQSSLNPRMTIGDTIEEPLRLRRLGKVPRRARLRELFEIVGLGTQSASRYPHAFSGGQRQRIGIARALAMEPSFLILDEPISALDVSVQAQIINLLVRLQDEFDLTYLLIAHDLSAVRHMSDRVAVMYLGRIVEMAATDDLFGQPLHPYTKALMSAVPIADPKVERNRRRIILQGDVASAANPPSGCRFHTRCPYATPDCGLNVPEFREVAPGHFVEYCCDTCIGS